jgi:hypothetical protein
VLALNILNRVKFRPEKLVISCKKKHKTNISFEIFSTTIKHFQKNCHCVCVCVCVCGGGGGGGGGGVEKPYIIEGTDPAGTLLIITLEPLGI